MATKIDGKINRFLHTIKSIPNFKKIKFILLYGSMTENKFSNLSDIDICIYYDGNSLEANKFRLKLLTGLSEDIYDIQLYQELPTYLKINVLKGKILYCPNKKFLYKIALETIKKFEDFKRMYYDYIKFSEISI